MDDSKLNRGKGESYMILEAILSTLLSRRFSTCSKFHVIIFLLSAQPLLEKYMLELLDLSLATGS